MFENTHRPSRGIERLIEYVAAISSSAEPECTPLDGLLNATEPIAALRCWLELCGLVDSSMASVRSQLVRDIARLDEVISLQVNEILHHPDFQALESAWRGLEYLWRTRRTLLADVSGRDTVPEVEIRLLSVTKKELRRDFEDAIEFDQSTLFKIIYEQEFGTPGGHPYGLLIANYDFSAHSSDIELLTQLSGVGAAAFCPVIAAASPSLLGVSEYSELEQPLDLQAIFRRPRHRLWKTLREHVDSRFLGLVAPRILLRCPYDHTSPCQGFAFSEDVSALDRSNYLWGSAAWAFGGVVLRAFVEHGWFADIRGVERGTEGRGSTARVRGGGLVTGLPSISHATDAVGTVLRPSVDVNLGDVREAELCDLGFILLSHCKDTRYCVFYSNQSVHLPQEFTDPVASVNARISSMLQYVLCCSRIAHYLKVQIREKIGSVNNRQELEDELKRWLADLSTPNENADPDIKAQFPLRNGDVVVSEDSGAPGKYSMTMYLLPHYQLDQLSSGVKFIARTME